uniref:CRAL-TRIO domain-containing protein n=1 Tax=Trichuris muris TaxID=70415 RepID=A0A5S6QRG7_TRIMR
MSAMAAHKRYPSANSDRENLTPEQKAALRTVEERILANDTNHIFHDDRFYIFRFFKAVQFSADKAERMLKQHITYRRILGLDGDKFMDQINPQFHRYFTRGEFGFDREGRPVVYFPFGSIDPKGMLYSFKGSEVMKAMLAYQEHSRRLCMKIREERKCTVYQSIYVIDMQGIGQKHLWKPGLEVFSQIASCLEQHAPESLYRLYIINAPTIFNVFYQIVRPVLDENTKKKIKVYGNDYKSALLEDIAPECLPAFYGGACFGNNDDKKCSHAISYGGPVPKELYFNDTIKPNKLSTLTVNRQSETFIPLQVDADQTTISWYVKSLSQNDIGFGIYYSKDGRSTAVEDMEMIVPYFRLLTCFVPEYGSVQVLRRGTYFMRLNNKYSYFTSKHLEYGFSMTKTDTASD